MLTKKEFQLLEASILMMRTPMTISETDEHGPVPLVSRDSILTLIKLYREEKDVIDRK